MAKSSEFTIYLTKNAPASEGLCPSGTDPSTCTPSGPILSVFPALIVHSELKSVHPGFPVAFFKAQVD